MNSGIITLTDKQNGQTAKMLCLQGQFADAMIRNLKGVDALYQLLERPMIGSFVFVPHTAVNTKNALCVLLQIKNFECRRN